MRVLLIEDDAILADGLRRSLEQLDLAVDHSENGADAESVLRSQEYDLIILDLSLPEMDGLDVLRSVRSRKVATPVLITTARFEIDDRIKGLDFGADDYLTKPFNIGEFEARVRALLRRSQSQGLNELTCGDLSLDLSGRRAYLNGIPLDLPKREFSILEVLISSQGRIVEKQHIIDHISSFDEELTSSAIEIYISRLRKKIGLSDVQIRTVRGVGYSLE